MTEKMKTACFNLVDEAWLPVTLAENFPDAKSRGPLPRVSLREIFEHGDKIVDLRCYPHERIALMRLLICVAQRALNGPEDENDWKKCRERLASEAMAYLDKQKDCFNLLGNGPRFLQGAKLKPTKEDSKPVSMDKLSLVLAAGSTTTLFDNAGGQSRQLSHAELAMALVTFQVCSPGGLIGIANWNGVPTGKDKSSQHSVGARKSAVHGFLLGDSLIDTVHANLITKETFAAIATSSGQWGYPVWEKPPANLKDVASCSSYLGRQVPFARAIWILEGCKDAWIANGLTYDFFPEGLRDPSITVVLQDDAPVALRARSDKALWRELHSIASYRGANQNASGPITLKNGFLLTQERRLWTGALLTTKDNDAKVIDCIESVFHLPTQFLEDADAALGDHPLKSPGPNQTYRRGVEFADHWAGKLQWAVHVYHQRLNDDFSRKQNSGRGKKVKNHAAMRFWTTLEQRAEPVLLHDVALNSSKYWRAEGDWMARSPWGWEVWKAAHDAYDFACPHGSPRQLRAYAAGLAVLTGVNRAKSASTAEADAGNDSTEGDES
jgi:CRISPR system Cascade subunit CasA